mmetsp:Transcript_14741/g.41922  ORF Transcript_14741/g.41922 Transcript_14741/m.41922 type:complete len:226 (+) Transcript_14741:184-861(+)|eukprot:CAMPEP_0119127620 /NCGR_PEP_ID=MMETSP1310-20130426/6101_1 /TAXON_ID=464262 /ORGANISM="Genus nov. species nov., Strain RCC2339" /LENGTH=225 /DNA_ID=CAMNT_0007117895 /DNA_START=96 /DNA_END=773 /DNA_ORIENTATION=-
MDKALVQQLCNRVGDTNCNWDFLVRTEQIWHHIRLSLMEAEFRWTFPTIFGIRQRALLLMREHPTWFGKYQANLEKFRRSNGTLEEWLAMEKPEAMIVAVKKVIGHETVDGYRKLRISQAWEKYIGIYDDDSGARNGKSVSEVTKVLSDTKEFLQRETGTASSTDEVAFRTTDRSETSSSAELAADASFASPDTLRALKRPRFECKTESEYGFHQREWPSTNTCH